MAVCYEIYVAVAQFQAKFDAVALLQSFRHFPCNEKSREHYTLPHSNAACQQLTLSTGGKKFTHAH